MRAFIIAGLVAAGLGGPALAYEQTTSANGDQVRAVQVKSAANLADRAQADGLYARLKRAADQACSTESADWRLARPDQACVDQALAEAVRHADKPLLTAAYQADASVANRAFAGNDQ